MRNLKILVKYRKGQTNEAHRKISAERRLESNGFLHFVKTANFPPKVIRCSEWVKNPDKTPNRTSVNLDESRDRRYDSSWTTWRCLNRLCTCYTCSKEQQKKWKYFDGDTTCECGLATENTAHILQCTLFARPYALDDLSNLNNTEKYCVETVSGSNSWGRDSVDTICIAVCSSPTSCRLFLANAVTFSSRMYLFSPMLCLFGPGCVFLVLAVSFWSHTTFIFQ